MATKNLKFDPKTFDEIIEFLKEWDKWRRENNIGRPDSTSDAIFLLPLTLSLLKAESRLSKLTIVLIFLTVILSFETLFLIIR